MKKIFILFIMLIWGSYGCFSPSEQYSDTGSDSISITDISISDISSQDKPPVIISVEPSAGYTEGGIDVTINGMNFVNGLKVFFGDKEADVKTLLSGIAIVVVNPPYKEGKVDIKVINPDGLYGVLKAGFEYKKKETPIDGCVYKKCDIKPTIFKYDSSKAGFSVSKVELASQFTNWGENKILMNDEGISGDEVAGDGIYSVAINLKSGQYEYKFILNGNQWVNDPDNSEIEPIFKNSVILVKDGCHPEIIEYSIKNGDIISSPSVTLQVRYDLNGKMIDKSGSYFVIDGVESKGDIYESDGRISVSKNLADGAHWYYVVIRDMECNKFVSPSIFFIVKTSNKLPVANAGYTQIVERGDKVILDGTLSEDPYQIGIENFIWDVLESPEPVNLSDEYATDWAGYNYDPNATPPKVRSLVSFIPQSEGYYKFSLRVSNSDGESDDDETDVYVLKKSTSLDKPLVRLNIGVNGNTVSLDATNSIGANSNNLEFIWIEDIKNPERFNLGKVANQQIVLNKDGAYFIYLIVSDGYANSSIKRVFLLKRGDKIFAQDFAYSSEWFKGSNIYEIFVRKFADGDGDGIGDLTGLTEKINYLKGLGVKTIWLMPVFRSNDKDHGYHTVDYYTIEPDYGNNEDLFNLVSEAHKSGIKVVLDMVINHTSRRHPFFIEALNMNPFFRNYYIWFENNSQNLYDKYGYGREMGGTRLTLENGWAEIPDLNYSNPVMRQYIYNMLRYWLDPNGDGDFSDGVDGFRIDHVTGPSHSVWMNLRRYVKSINPDAVLIAEVFRDFDNNNLGYGIKDYYNGEFDAAFTFPYYWTINSIVNGTDKPDLFDVLRGDIRKKFVSGVTHSFFIQNHDIPYKSTALKEYGGYNETGILRQISAASLMFLFPNAPQILYGEELGITEYRGFMPWENYNDQNALYNFYKTIYKIRSEMGISADSKFYFVPNSQPDSVYSFYIKSDSNRLLGVINMKDTYVDTVNMNIGVLRESSCGALSFVSVIDYEVKDVEENYQYLFVGPLKSYEVKLYKIEEKSSIQPVKVKFLLNTKSKSMEIEEGRYAFISGDIIQIGNWVPNAIALNKTGPNSSYYETFICNGIHIEYKYIIDFGAIERWDGVEFGGENRKVTIYGDNNNEMEISDTFGIR